jgi:inorganic pyrophosphatase
VAASTGKINSSVPEMLRSLDVQILQNHTSQPDDEFVLVDISEPEYFDTFVSVPQVREIFDHHPGFEDFWQDILGEKSRIEHIGAACTLIFEEWEKAGILAQISHESALLLACGILDNTLNFGAQISTQRDQHAYDTLVKIANLPTNLPEIYFSDCQKMIERNIEATIKNDTKKFKVAIGQIAIWDANEILQNYRDQIAAVLLQFSPDWYANIICIKDGKSHFLCTNEKLKNYLTQLLDLKFVGDIATADRMWLRKEIFKTEITKNTNF